MPLAAGDIRKNIQVTLERIGKAATLSGRAREDIRLVAVSKKMSADNIMAAIAGGQRCFGENTLQDAASKQTLIDDPGNEWHFIGHLQTNKARAVTAGFDWLHTLDSIKLAHRLSAANPDSENALKVLLQVNITGDTDKSGLAPGSVFTFIDTLLQTALPGIDLRGLMTIGRRAATIDQRRAEFAALRKLGADCATRFGARYFSELSMGMSNDFETAITEGATIVRVGSAIFGPRLTNSR